MEKTSAVLVRDAYKAYGKKQVLNGLCMKVSPGSIYGLLGASGCGKTTLLSCIVGRKKLNSGQLWVLGGKPGTKGSGVPGPRVGYMPQDIALVAEFTVKDAVYYFGRILGMDEETIEERLRVLSKLLDLPPDDRILKNCSGGQQRRVSFAAAMVHKPQLLILDEPTVGLDPVLRDSIWNHLVEITEKENTAVIITTHYIEEARQAHAIGLMREGKLLAEESPQQLLTMFHTDSLEEVFLALSRKQEEGRLNGIELRYSETNGTAQMGNSTVSLAMTELGQGSTVELTPKREDTPKEKYEHISPFSVSKHRMNALMKKNWMQFSRNYSSVLFTILFPILEMVSFFIAIGGDIKSINLAVVNDENFNQMCAPNYTINGTAIPYNFSDCEFHDLSCRFLMELDHPMIHPVYYKSLPEAIEGIKHGKVVGALYIPSNFSESLQERINEGRRVTDESLDFGSIKVWLDMSNRQIGTTIKYKLYSLYTDFQKKVFKDCRFLPELAGIPVRFNDPVYGKDDDPYTVFVMPGMLLTMMFFMGTTMTSTIIISDRVEGVWDRSIVAGVTSLEIMITHFIMQIILIFFQMVESLILTFAIYKSEYIGSLITIALITLIQGLCGMSYGFWISIVSPTHSFANIISTGSFYPMILVCGLVWPLEGMPIGLRWFSRCLPFTVAIESLRNVIAKGWTIAHTEVWNGIVISLAWIFALGIISALMLKTKR